MRTADFIRALADKALITTEDRDFLLLGCSTRGRHADRVRESVPTASGSKGKPQAAGVTLALHNGLGRFGGLGTLFLIDEAREAFERVDTILGGIVPQEGSAADRAVQEARKAKPDGTIERWVRRNAWLALSSCEGFRFSIDAPPPEAAQVFIDTFTPS